MTRVAQCHCGQVRVACEGEPYPVVMCSCQLCQRRTGSPIHIGAWFAIEDVTIDGETNAYTRNTGDQGREFTFNFCPNCGTPISFESKRWPEEIHLFVCTFVDPESFEPRAHVYTAEQLSWLHLGDDLRRYEKTSG